MPFSESSKAIITENQENEGPIDVNSPEKLERFLALKDSFAENFQMEKGRESELVDQLNENDKNLVYRGMSPEYIFKLIRGEKIEIKPYRFEDIDPDNPPEEDLQNASLNYSNAIMHGYDPKERYNFLAVAGFSQKGLHLQKTGKHMADRLAGAGDIDSIPENRADDITIEGELDPKNVEVYCFRFRVGDKFKTLVYRKKENTEKQQNWAGYISMMSECVSKNDPEYLEFLLEQPHPLMPGEREAFLWLKENTNHKLNIKLDKTKLHVVKKEQKA